MRSLPSLKLTFWRWLARHASSALWRACADVPGRFGPAVAFGNVGLDASRRCEASVAGVAAAFDLTADNRTRIDAALEARAICATLSPFARTAVRALERIRAFERAALAGVPDIEINSTTFPSVSEILVHRPITLARALGLAGFPRPQAAVVRREDLEKLNAAHGEYASGDEPRVIAVARRSEPELVAAWLLPIVKQGRLSAAHLRGSGNVWWDIFDRLVALPAGTRIFVATPPV